MKTRPSQQNKYFLPASQDAGNRIGLEPVIFYTILKYVEHYNKKSI
jgi:hypothetical protein